MTIMGIVLLIAGALLFIASFLVSDSGRGGKNDSKAMGLKLDRMIDERVNEVKERLSDVAVAAREEEEIKAQRELERITNEKIMAIDDYSKVVLEEIEKNHKEAMFLYDMLDHKTSDVKNTIRKADAYKEQQQESINKQETVSRPEDIYNESEAGFSILQEPEFQDDKKALSGMDRLRNAINGLTGGGDTSSDEGIDNSLPSDAPADEAAADRGEAKETELSRNEQVLEMKRSGMDNVDIAKSLNMGVGEVNLITDLFSGKDGDGGEES